MIASVKSDLVNEMGQLKRKVDDELGSLKKLLKEIRQAQIET